MCKLIKPKCVFAQFYFIVTAFFSFDYIADRSSFTDLQILPYLRESVVLVIRQTSDKERILYYFAPLYYDIVFILRILFNKYFL